MARFSVCQTPTGLAWSYAPEPVTPLPGPPWLVWEFAAPVTAAAAAWYALSIRQLLALLDRQWPSLSC
jgi:hypothetical protein